MAKLDKHAALIKELFAKTGNARATHEGLRQGGIEVSYETVRQWLRRHKDEIPGIRIGAGLPKTKEPEQLFSIFRKDTDWVPATGIYPEFFVIFTERKGMLGDAVLVKSLERLGIKNVTMERLGECEVPLKELRNLCELELYLFTYLLAGQGPLVGVSDREYDERIRTTTVMAIRLRKVVMSQKSIKLGDLREMITKSLD